MVDLHDVLGTTGAILASDRDRGICVSWNGSATFNLWSIDGGSFTALDCRTRYDVTYEQAEVFARAWVAETDGEEPDGEDPDNGEEPDDLAFKMY